MTETLDADMRERAPPRTSAWRMDFRPLKNLRGNDKTPRQAKAFPPGGLLREPV
jgi:hypothetical protein